MKYAVIFISAAALVGAAPYCQTAAVEANEPKPATATEATAKKLPFIETGVYAGTYCGMLPGTIFQHTDKNCGTAVFCQAFNDQQEMRDYLQAEPQFKNAKDCLDAHDPEPTGEEANEPKPATATEATAKKLPFIETGAYAGTYCGMLPGTIFQHTDKNCGTAVFCQAFNDQQKMRDYLQAEPQFKNEKDCLDAHEPRLS